MCAPMGKSDCTLDLLLGDRLLQGAGHLSRNEWYTTNRCLTQRVKHAMIGVRRRRNLNSGHHLERKRLARNSRRRYVVAYPQTATAVPCPRLWRQRFLPPSDCVPTSPFTQHPSPFAHHTSHSATPRVRRHSPHFAHRLSLRSPWRGISLPCNMRCNGGSCWLCDSLHSIGNTFWQHSCCRRAAPPLLPHFTRRLRRDRARWRLRSGGGAVCFQGMQVMRKPGRSTVLPQCGRLREKYG